MNLYFVFEGKTEPIVYKEWFKILLPNLAEVNAFDEVVRNNYFYESDMGIPDCYNVVASAVQEINEHPIYDYLVLFVDADRFEVDERRAEAFQFIEERLQDAEKAYEYQNLPINCQLVVLVQKVCIETWFLGNRTFFVRNPQNNLLREYVKYFDTSNKNPENLAEEFVQNENGTANIFGYSTKALFHEGYLREIFKERLNGIGYKKSRPREVQQETYLMQLIERTIDNPQDLLSFKELLNFCKMIEIKLIDE